MAVTTNRRMTREEYLKYDDGTDTNYALETIEIVSAGGSNEQRDYRYKRSEYAARHRRILDY